MRKVAISTTKRPSDPAVMEQASEFKVLPLLEILARGDWRRYSNQLVSLVIKFSLKNFIVDKSARQLENTEIVISILSGTPIVLSKCLLGKAVASGLRTKANV